MYTTFYCARKSWTLVLCCLFPLLNWAAVHQVSTSGLTNHADPTNTLSIQYAINNAAAGDVVELISNGDYVLTNQLVLKSKVTLKGRRWSSGFEHQKVIASQLFPEDLAMIKLHGGDAQAPTTLNSVRFDAKNLAWRVVETTEGEDYYTLLDCRFEKTKNKFTTSDTGQYTSPNTNRPYYDVSLMICEKSDHIKIEDCLFLTAGLNWFSGKENPLVWRGFGSGIKFYFCDHLEIKNSKIERTLTEGIRLWGCRHVLIDNNEINRTALNNEWYDLNNSNKGIVASAITGYHNQSAKRAHYGGAYCDVDHDWVISNNRFFWNANNALSLSGKGIVVHGNRVNYTFQNALFLGDWRNCTNGAGFGYDYECVRDVSVYNNDFDNSYYDPQNWSWVYNTPTGLSQSFAAPAADIRVNGYDQSVDICNNINVSVTYETDKTDCGCKCSEQSTLDNNLQIAENKKEKTLEEKEEVLIKLFPNPVDKELVVDLGQEVEYLEFTITDLNGRLMMNEKKEKVSSLSIETERLPKGMYILQLDNKKENKRFQFIKE